MSSNTIASHRPPPAQSAPVPPGRRTATTRPAQSAPVNPGAREAAKADTVENHTLIKRGARGGEVSDLQERLRQAGYEPGENGVYDAKTEAAVRQYQKDNGLKVDGIVGQQTWGHFVGETLPPGTEKLGARHSSPGGGVGHDPTDSFEPAGSGRSPPGGGQSGQTPSQPPSRDPGQTGGAQGPAGASPAPAKGSTVDRMLAEARSHVGYREGAGNSNKFSTAMGRPAEPWCADFVSYVARQAGAKTVNTASAQGIADQLAKQGRWKGRNNPQPGDAVTFNWSGSGGRANHVGLVESVFQQNGQTYIRTIEGNSSDGVRYRTYPASSRVINGFGTIA